MLHGREAEQAVLFELLKSVRRGRSAALALRGTAGIGKSALIADTVAQEPELRVLRAVGIDSESGLAFGALHQLLRPIIDLVDEIPEPQAAALRSAVGMAAPGGEDAFLVGAGVLSLLAVAADGRPLLCIVEDAQWLDVPSNDALMFVARRLDAERIAIIFVARDAMLGEPAFESGDLPQMHLDGLGREAAQALVAERFHDAIAPGPRSRLIAAAAGNPLALLELPFALTKAQRGGQEAIPEILPLTQRLENMYGNRTRSLSEGSRLFVLVAAADNSGDPAIVRRAAEALEIEASDIDAIEAIGLLRVRETSVEWRHPLVRSAAYHHASVARRRDAHLALAAALTDPRDIDRRALQLAAAAEGLDETIASELEASAARAHARGGFASAATVLARSAALTEDGERRARRLLAAAEAEARALGRSNVARPWLDEARKLTEQPTLVADIERLRGAIELEHGSAISAGEILLAAATEIEEIDPARAAVLVRDAAAAATFSGARAQIEVGRRAAALRLQLPSSFELTVVAGIARLHDGDPSGADLLKEALAVAESSDLPSRWQWAARCALHLGDASAARAYATRDVASARREGAVVSLVSALRRIALAEIIDGRLTIARANASEGFTLAGEAGLENAARSHQALLALIAALLGRADDARNSAAAVLELAGARDLAWNAAVARFALGMLELAGGQPNEAIPHFQALSTTDSLAASPYVSLIAGPALVEAGVRAGRVDVARAALAQYESWVTTTGSASNVPLLDRSRALLARGDEARDHFERALSGREDANPLQRARTELLYGEWLRRAGRRRDARDHLRIALELFDQIGSPVWSSRAATELRATGEKLLPRRSSGEHDLTPQELQVARFVAAGATNKEVAAQLFLSPRTIDAHLRQVFRKLGITTRTQLAQFDLGEPGAVSPL
jgi:DNA-binding CsgD family transcriptional regulator